MDPRVHAPHIVLWILSCPQRTQALGKTLHQLRETDWPTAPRIHLDEGKDDAAGNAVLRGHLGLLRSALAGPGTHFLVLEDDISANRHLHWNVTHWELWQRVEEIHFATFYHPCLRELRPFCATAASFPASSALGAQARLISRACATHIVAGFRSSGLRQDRQFAELASALGPLWLHRPSLVQHMTEESTWGGPQHQARDFDPAFRTPRFDR